MQLTYLAETYSPEAVTGRYVRVQGKKPNYIFKVFEVATNNQKGSMFFGQAGMGYTLREYLTAGEGLPLELKERCIKSKTTEKWD